MPSVHQSSVVFRPVTVNMNAPPSVCLPKHFPLSVLLSFTFSFCSLLPTSSLLCLYCPSSPLLPSSSSFLSSCLIHLPLLSLISSPFFPTNRQTGRRERSVQSGVLVSITCLWRTDPGRQLCSCRVNPELRLSGNRAPTRGRSRLRALTLRLLLQNHPPPLRLLLLPPSRRGWCSSWQHQ